MFATSNFLFVYKKLQVVSPFKSYAVFRSHIVGMNLNDANILAGKLDTFRRESDLYSKRNWLRRVICFWSLVNFYINCNCGHVKRELNILFKFLKIVPFPCDGCLFCHQGINFRKCRANFAANWLKKAIFPLNNQSHNFFTASYFYNSFSETQYSLGWAFFDNCYITLGVIARKDFFCNFIKQLKVKLLIWLDFFVICNLNLDLSFFFMRFHCY